MITITYSQSFVFANELGETSLQQEVTNNDTVNDENYYEDSYADEVYEDDAHVEEGDSLEYDSDVSQDMDGGKEATNTSMDESNSDLPESSDFINKDMDAPEDGFQDSDLAEIVDSGTVGNNLSWELDSEGNLTISGSGNMYDYTGSNSPFYNRKDIKSLILSTGITKIGSRAFYNCTEMNSVINRSEALNTIGTYAFYGCSKLEGFHDLSESSNYSVGTYAFYGCSSLTEFPFEKIGVLESYTFSRCGFTDLVLPGSITKIYEASFKDCYKLTNVYLCKGIAYVQGGEKYQSTYNGQVVNGVRMSPFNGCSSVKVLFCGEENKPGSWGSEWNRISQGGYNSSGYSVPVNYGASLEDYQFGCKNIDNEKSVIVPTGVTKLYGKFRDNTTIESITLPESYTTIESYAFYGCSNLKEVLLPESLSKIDGYAFYNCTSLVSFNIPNGVTTIGDAAFSGCSNLKEIYVPKSVTNVTSYSFSGYTNSVVCEGNPGISPSSPKEFLTDVSRELLSYINCLDPDTSVAIIPDNISVISDNVLHRFTNLDKLFIPRSITAFSQNAVIPDSIQRIWYEGNTSDFQKLDLSSIISDKCNVTYNADRSDMSLIKSITMTSVSGIEDRPYTGNNIYLDLIIKDDNKELTEGIDYNLFYNNNKERGTATIRIAGIGKYYDSIFEEFEILSPSTDNVTVEAIPDQSYSGRRITPPVKVLLGDYELTEGEDYTLAYRDNTDIGTAYVDIKLSELFTGTRLLTKSFTIKNDPSINQDELGYLLTYHTNNKSFSKRFFENDNVSIQDVNDVAYRSFSKWRIQSGELLLSENDLKANSISFTMPASNVEIAAVYVGQSLEDDLADENSRHNAVISRASTLDANIELYTNTADKIKNKYGVSYLQSSTYYANQATSTQNTITKKQNQLAALRADTAGGHQVEIKQLEAEIKELQSDYQMYLELKSAAQYQEKADDAQKERNKINLTTEEQTHNNNIASICTSHGVKNESVNEIKYIRLDKDEYDYTGSPVYPIITVIDSSGKELGNESYDILYPSDCTSAGKHVITLKLKGDYTGTKNTTFAIVKHQYSEWIVTKEPTCTETGEKEKHCSDCGKIIKESIPITHIWDSKYTVDKEATCTTAGSESIHCTKCDAIKEGSSKAIPIKAHSFGAWKTTKEATEVADGQKTCTCSVCGHSDTQAIAMLKPTLPSVKISKPVSAKKAATVKWKKVSKANQKKIAKIEIQYSMDKTFKTGVKTVTAKKNATSKKITKLTSKKTYYVRIRAYKKSGGAVHVSKWSAIKKVKAK